MTKEWLIRSVFILMSACLAVFMLEVAVRFLEPPYGDMEGHPPLFNDQADVLLCNNTFGWTGTPNFQGSVEMPGIKADLVFNSLGMHDTEHPLKKPAGAFRIMMLGDSYVHAIQLNENLTAHQRLEDYLNQNAGSDSINYEVVSSGVTGWGTGQELRYYQAQGREFKPDLVLLMLFLGNDFEDNLPGYALTIRRFNCYAPYFAVCDGQLNPEPLTYAPGISDLSHNCSPWQRWLINGAGKLYQTSRLYQQLEPLIISRRPRQLFGTHYPNPFLALYIPNDEPALEQAWQTTEGIIAQLRAEVEADGAEFGVVFFPWSVIIEFSALPPAQQQAAIAENPLLTEVEIDRPNQRLIEFFERENIPYLDLTPLITEHQRSQTEPLHFVGDAHWTIEGNRFVGEMLSNWLIQNKLLTPMNNDQ